MESLTNCRAQAAGGGGLFGAQVGRGEIGVGDGEGRVGVDRDRLQRMGVDEAADDRVGNPGMLGQFAHAALAAFEFLERAGALGRHACGHEAGGPIFDQLARRGEGGRRQHHAQHAGEGREVIVGGPLDEPAEGATQRRDVELGDERAQAIVADFLGGQPLGLPRDGGQLARPERDGEEVAGRDVDPLGHAIVERAQCGIQGDDTGAGETHREPS